VEIVKKLRGGERTHNLGKNVISNSHLQGKVNSKNYGVDKIVMSKKKQNNPKLEF